MFIIKSYIQNPNIPVFDLEKLKKNPLHYFIDINNADKILHIKNDLDLNYIEGAIYLTYNNQVILDFGTYDLIDHLWAYFLNMIEEFIQNKKYAEMDFPDSSVQMTMKDIKNQYILFSIKKHIVSEWKLPKYEFLNTLLFEAKDFFEKMILLIEEKNNSYQVQLKKIKLLKQKINDLKKVHKAPKI
jgi:hypothetical protein